MLAPHLRWQYYEQVCEFEPVILGGEITGIIPGLNHYPLLAAARARST